MSLFNYYKYPNVPEGMDLPRKKGVMRLFELLGRDMLHFFLAGLLALLSLIPFIIGMIYAVYSHSILVMFVTGIVGGILAAPQICGVADTLMRSMRDEAGFWWHTYKKAWKNNAKSSLFPGGMFGLIFAAQLFFFYHIEFLGEGKFPLIMLIVSLILSFGLASFVFLMLVVMELPMGALFRNAAVLFIGYLPRGILAALFQGVWYIACILFYPFSFLFILLGNVWFPMLLSAHTLYKPLNERLGIEEAIAKRKNEADSGSADNN